MPQIKEEAEKPKEKISIRHCSKLETSARENIYFTFMFGADTLIGQASASDAFLVELRIKRACMSLAGKLVVRVLEKLSSSFE